jgi:hypothetical protein
MYSRDTFVTEPVIEGVRRTLNWVGFHATAVIGGAFWTWRERDWRLGAWFAISVLGIVGGLRFFPRYYFHILPVVALLGARGLLMLGPRMRTAALSLLLIPVIRFGPGYIDVAMAGAAGSRDTAMMRDSRVAGGWLKEHALPGSDLFVWGYRPDVYVYSGLSAATRFLDSQPLTGVLADRHLFRSQVSAPEVAAINRAELVRSRPAFVVDGLGPMNRGLAITEYPDLREWLARYETAWSSNLCIVYKRRD